MASESTRYIVYMAGRAVSDWVARVLNIPGTKLVRQTTDEHAIVRMPPAAAEQLQVEFPDITIEEDVRHRIVAR